jgi:hypothetical protein
MSKISILCEFLLSKTLSKILGGLFNVTNLPTSSKNLVFLHKFDGRINTSQSFPDFDNYFEFGFIILI